MTDNTSDLDILLAVCREERDKLPHGQLTTGEAVHYMVLEILGQIILRAQQKKVENL